MTKFKFETSSTAGVIEVEIDAGDSDDPRPRLAVVHRAEVSNLTEEWGPGAYVLVDLMPSDGHKRKAYVGKATMAGVSNRIKNHIAKSQSLENWIFAVVIYGQIIKGSNRKFSSDFAHGLEYKLLKAFEKHSGIEVSNQQTPGEPALPETDWIILNSYVKPVLDLLKVMGCDVNKKPSLHWLHANKPSKAPTKKESVPAPSSPNEPSATIEKPKRSKKYYGEKLSDLVETGYLMVGDRLVPSTKNGFAPRFSGEGIVVESDGRTFIEIKGELYSTPSPAAMAISGRTTEPGWDFLERSSDGKTLFEIRAKYRLEVKGIDD